MLRELESARPGAGGVPRGAAEADARLLGAAREDLLAFTGTLFTLFGARSPGSCHSVRAVRVLTAMGWAEVSERYLALGLEQPAAEREFRFCRGLLYRIGAGAP